MEAVVRITLKVALVTLIAVFAVACGPPTVKTAVGQGETIEAAAQAVDPDVSESTRVSAYCAIEETAVTSLRPFRQAENPPRFGRVIGRAASLAVTVAEVAPDQIAGALRTQRSELRRIDQWVEQGTYDVLAYSRPGMRLTTRSQAFLQAVAAIAAFDREVCGIE